MFRERSMRSIMRALERANFETSPPSNGFTSQPAQEVKLEHSKRVRHL